MRKLRLARNIKSDYTDKETGEIVESREFIEYDDIPTWAIYYMMYGDDEGLTEEDKEMVDKWMEREELGELVDVVDEESHFTYHPEFGLGADCERCVFRHIGK